MQFRQPGLDMFLSQVWRMVVLRVVERVCSRAAHRESDCKIRYDSGWSIRVLKTKFVEAVAKLENGWIWFQTKAASGLNDSRLKGL